MTAHYTLNFLLLMQPGSSLWNNPTYIQNGSSYCNEPELYNPSQTHLKVCLLGDSRSCQFDNRCLPPQGLILARKGRHCFALPTSEGFFFLQIVLCWLLTPVSCSCWNSCSSKCRAIFMSSSPLSHIILNVVASTLYSNSQGSNYRKTLRMLPKVQDHVSNCRQYFADC